MMNHDHPEAMTTLKNVEPSLSRPIKLHHGVATTRKAFMPFIISEKKSTSTSSRPIDELCINTIRTVSMDAVQQANSGHPGTPMGLAPVAYALWQNFLRFDRDAPVLPGRDRFVLSNGHASMLPYAILHLTGVKAVDAEYKRLDKPSVTLDDIKNFREIGSRRPGHPEYHVTTGVETTTGPLGQGCATSVGMAIAERWLAQHFNRPGFPVFDYNVYTLCGDGDMMEGVTSEAASLAGHRMLGNLCWINDSNRITIEDYTDLAFSDDIAARFLAYGWAYGWAYCWNVTRVGDANDAMRIRKSIEAFQHVNHVPTLIIVESHTRILLTRLDDFSVSLKDITEDLLKDGGQQFAASFNKFLGAVAGRRRTLLEGNLTSLEIGPGSREMKAAFEAEMEVWRKDGRIRRLWAGDKSLWGGTDEDQWVGWLHIVEQELADFKTLSDFAKKVSHGGFTDVVLLGMGGSSLGPEVLNETFGRQPGWPRFHMLDSTDPAEIMAIEQAVDLAKTLFIVSSKSGGTLEPNIFMDYFIERVAAVRGKDKVGAHFVVVTDPGSSLERQAKRLHFAHIFHGTPSIGGRYSVLSKFGLAPAAAMGLDIRRLLETTQMMELACGPDVPPAENPGVQLGVAMGVAATRFGRDKVTIIGSPGIAALGPWLEQLLAEGTGKHGRGLIPLAGEPLTLPEYYGNDRFFVYLELEGQDTLPTQEALAALERAGHPIVRIIVKDVLHLGQEFFRWEIATAVAGAIIGIDPFDQPDVEASKKKTSALARKYEKSHGLPKEKPLLQGNGLALYADPRNAAELGRHKTIAGYLKSHFGRVHAGLKSGDYVALLAYIQRNASHTRALTAMRVLIRDRTHAATCVGFGPRFQHSTGQAYKGGPNSGVFLQITCDELTDIEVPGHSYSFGAVKAMQAISDLEVLVERGRRTLRVHLTDVDAGLEELARVLDIALN
jgi:glucose-6-phosphate isomerase/transketolase N-terminal domain/subunit